jgi:hypothetical protein
MAAYEPTKSGTLFQEWRVSQGYFKPKDLTQAFNSHSHGYSEHMVVNVEAGKNLINPQMLEFFYKTGKMSQETYEAILAARKDDERAKWEKKNGKTPVNPPITTQPPIKVEPIATPPIKQDVSAPPVERPAVTSEMLKTVRTMMVLWVVGVVVSLILALGAFALNIPILGVVFLVVALILLILAFGNY